MKSVRENRVIDWLQAYVRLLADLDRAQDKAHLFRAMLRYIFHADATAPSTFADLVSKLPSAEIKESFMSIADQLKQEGRQEGFERGRVIGKIQACQELLGLPAVTLAELQRKEASELESLLHALEARVRARLT